MRQKKHSQKAAGNSLVPKKGYLLTLSSLYLKGIFDPTLLVAFAVMAWSAFSIIQPHLTPLDIPYGDGWGFSSRAIQMHGLLHSGRFHEFWVMLISPMMFTLLPTYAIFWLVPTAWVSGVSYGVIHTIIWHILMLFGAWGILSEMKMTRLLPAVLLMTFANNNILDYTLYYYMDMSFAACGIVALWLLVRALLRQNCTAILLAGVSAGLILFVKPGNAFLFLPCYAVAVVVFLLGNFVSLERADRREWARKIGQGAFIWLSAFFPLFLLACYWTLIPNVVIRFLGNTSAYWAGETSDSLFLRLFYYPLCLSYYYSFMMMALSAVGAWIVARWWVPLKDEIPCRPAVIIRWIWLALVCGFIIFWGGIFSFVMQQKVIRSLPLMLPLLWIAIFVAMARRWRVIRGVTIFAALYFALAHVQFSLGALGEKQNRGTEGYELKGDWLNRLPAKAPDLGVAAGLTRSILDALARSGVSEGKVGVGTEMLYWNSTSLNWVAQIPYLQMGQKPLLDFITVSDNRGNPLVANLDGAIALMLVVHPAIQYSRGVYEFNVKTAQYAQRKWNGSIASSIQTLSFGDGKPALVLVIFRKPFGKQELSSLLSDSFPGTHADQSDRESYLLERRLPLREYWRLIRDARN